MNIGTRFVLYVLFSLFVLIGVFFLVCSVLGLQRGVWWGFVSLLGVLFCLAIGSVIWVFLRRHKLK